MHVRQWHLPERHSLHVPPSGQNADLVIAFGDCDSLAGSDGALSSLASTFPAAEIIGATSSRFIIEGVPHDEGVGIAAIELSCSSVRVFPTPLGDLPNEAGRDTAIALQQEGTPKGILILWGDPAADLEEFLLGFKAEFQGNCPIAGGGASDQFSFDQTAVFSKGKACAAVVVAFYGDTISFSSAADSGWTSRNGTHQLTRTKGSTIYEIDGLPALDVYRNHIGEEEVGLPLTGLHFPFQLISPDGKKGLIRTPISVDFEKKTISCGGHVPEGECQLLTFTDPEDLLNGAESAAKKAAGSAAPGFSFFINCVARQTVLGPLADAEIDRAVDALHPEAMSFGMYAYGEIASTEISGECLLHNHTMAVAVLNENPPHQ